MFSARHGFFYAGVPAASVITTNLLVYYDAGNSSSYSGSGTSWYDLSGNGKTATLTNGPTYTSSDGGAIQFDGTNDYVVVPQFNDSTSDFTIEAWVRTATIGADNKTIWGHHTSGYGPRIEIDGSTYGHNRQIRFLHGTNTAWYWTEDYTGSIISDNAWYHIAATWSGTGDNYARIYVNSTEENSAYHSGTYATSLNAVPSIGSSAGQYWPGRVAIVRFYTAALSATEVAQNYNAEKSRFGM